MVSHGYRISGVLLPTDEGWRPGEVFTDGRGRIERVVYGSDGVGFVGSGYERIIYEGDVLLLPGVVDAHVHFREPGLGHTGASILSESGAAVAGGVTSFLDMPNTNPVCNSVDRVREKLAIAGRGCYANYGFYLGATGGNIESVAHAHESSEVPGVKLFMGSSTGDLAVKEQRERERVFEQCRLPVAVHCEDDRVLTSKMESYRFRYEGVNPEEVPFKIHSEIRSETACVNSVREVLGYVARYGTRVHVLHVSSGAELDLLGSFSSRYEGGRSPLLVETCPHYLHFTDADYSRNRGFVKCNPSVKSVGDRAALLAGLRSGAVDVLGSDHAPHALSAKAKGYFDCPSGVSGIEHFLPVVLEAYEMGCCGGLKLHEVSESVRVKELCAGGAAAFYGMVGRGRIEEGYWADLVLVRREEESYRIGDSSFSGCGWSAYAGEQTHFRVLCTLVNGRVAYRDGELYERAGEALEYVRGGRGL